MDESFESIVSGGEPEQVSFDTNPEDKTYKIAVRRFDDVANPKKFKYLLKKGVTLPYVADIQGRVTTLC